MISAARPRMRSLSGRRPETYERHLLHDPGRAYAETNCYADVVIELLHACRYEPLAAFASVVRMDFEGDQWTFFKPPGEDLERLFGIDIHEMQPYRSLPVQISEQIECHRTMIVELDSWYLPDTATTSYRTEHVKSSVAVDAIDVAGETLRYFHGPGMFELSGSDYRGVFGLDGRSEGALPPYAELVRFDRGPWLKGDELRSASSELLVHHLTRRPSVNPFHAFGQQLTRILPELLEQSLESYHAYAFATVRMAGSAFELLASYVDWLSADADAAPMLEIVDGCKALSFRLARRREFDPGPLLTSLAGAWERTLGAVTDSVVA